MTPQEEYRAALDEQRVAERLALRSPTDENIWALFEKNRIVRAKYAAVLAPAKPVPLGRMFKPMSHQPTSPPVRNERHSDWHPMSFRGQDN